MATLGLLVLAGILPVVADEFKYNSTETVGVGNYSFTFNMTEPHKIVQIEPDVAEIHTLDGGKITISTIGFGDSWWGMSSDDTLLESGKKNVGGEGLVDTNMCVFNIKSEDRVVIYLKSYPAEFMIDSTMNITRAVDFFRDVKISRIKRSH